MSLPLSTPTTAVLPLLPAFETDQRLRDLVLLQADKYSVFLLARLSRAEYERECATMRAATVEDAEIRRLLAAEKKDRNCGTCCEGMCIAPLLLTCIFIPLACYLAATWAEVRSALSKAWWRAFDAQIERLNRTYAARGLRFETRARCEQER